MESERSLAARLISEFEGQNWIGTLEYWMAGRIAELQAREPQLTGAKAREACRKECSELILRLKAERDERDSSSTRNSINRNLRVLTDAGGHEHWFRHPKPREVLELDKRCKLQPFERDALIERAIALHDEEKNALLFLATDDLVDAEDTTQDLDADLLDKLLGFRDSVLNEPEEKKGWRGRLKAASAREERLAILCERMRALGRELQRVVKELEGRG